ncbi:hypothetical protein QAD02_018815 [Eretmocerus hayati]|uniref:Uncharacterized protein n=1 Tax=Eretmocerus hayati TaxID=131215 RepID=A0ACC2PJ03_9HYME|nr:hypothetical protein QAD02_018815 [Eretmocerus hayati]
MKKKFKPREIAEFDERIQSVISNFVITNLFSATSLKTMFRKCGSHQPLCKAGLLEEVLSIQKEIAAKATVRCKEYELLDQFVRTYYLGTYGRWLDVPEIC